MAKVKNPTTFSKYFDIDNRLLDQLGVLDPTLAIDTKLFIDPLLLRRSSHPEIKSTAYNLYRKHFELIIKFLSLAKNKEGLAWRKANELLEFHEIRGTCLGYGSGSIHGRGFGPKLTKRILKVAKEIVDLGIQDPDLFPAMALFEENIGPDRISDMTTNVIRRALVDFNRRVLRELKLKGVKFNIQGENGFFLRNPFTKKKTPIILVPRDILRKLPIALDWDDICDAARRNQELRDRVNEHIAHIWANKTKRDKSELREEVLSHQAAFQTLLDMIHGVPTKPYNVKADPEGLTQWPWIAKSFTSKYPLNLTQLRKPKNIKDVYEVVNKILERYKQLIERNGLNKELYKEHNKPRHESTAQRLFFAIAFCYCEANNVDISPEVDSGSGQVDFKFSKGFDSRVLVEIKLSTNKNLIQGYKTQLEVYKEAEQTMRAVYVVLDVGRMGKKDEELIQTRNEYRRKGNPLSELIIVDGIIRPSASKR